MVQSTKPQKQKRAITPSKLDSQQRKDLDAHLEYCQQNLTPQQVLHIGGTAALHLKELRKKELEGGDGGGSSSTGKMMLVTKDGKPWKPTPASPIGVAGFNGLKRRMFFGSNESSGGLCPEDLLPLLTDFPNLVRCAPALDERFFCIDRTSPAALAREYPKRVTPEVRFRQRLTERFLAKVCAHNTIRARLNAAREKMTLREKFQLRFGGGSSKWKASGGSGSSTDDQNAGSSPEPHRDFQCVFDVETRKPFERSFRCARHRITGIRVDEREISDAVLAALICEFEARSKAGRSFLRYRPILPSRRKECVFLDWPARDEVSTPVVEEEKAEKHTVFDRSDSKFSEDSKGKPLNDLTPVLSPGAPTLMGIVVEAPPAAEYHPKEHMRILDLGVNENSSPPSPSPVGSPTRKITKPPPAANRSTTKDPKSTPEKFKDPTTIKSRHRGKHSEPTTVRRVRVNRTVGTGTRNDFSFLVTKNNELGIVRQHVHQPTQRAHKSASSSSSSSSTTSATHQQQQWNNPSRLQGQEGEAAKGEAFGMWRALTVVKKMVSAIFGY
ncbi:hypothetical protein HK102_008963 [Quaeritorhiza haematococci]|nr:hypothetical protein HK102_008963 [Quaeritorhiza haematococci]